MQITCYYKVQSTIRESNKELQNATKYKDVTGFTKRNKNDNQEL